jgi:O-antigen/teichoic acid export membrane protein
MRSANSRRISTFCLQFNSYLSLRAVRIHMASLTRNTFANYLGQGYTTIVAIVVLPRYLQYLGPEEFGLIGFFTLFITWLNMLTVGLSPTLARQVAVFRANHDLDSGEFRKILRSLELVILVLGLATAVCVWLSSSWIATHWLSTTYLDPAEVALSISMMGMIAGLRWGVSLYSSGMAGMEQQVWLNCFNVAVATARNIGGLLLVKYVSPEIGSYFLYQLVLSVIELLIIGGIFYTRQPSAGHSNDPGMRFSARSFRTILPFTLATAYSALAWVFVTQFDKLLLSKLLPLELFGYFSFVIILSNGVTRIADPINQAVLPRLTALVARGEAEAARALYSRMTQFLAVVSLPASAVIAVFAAQTLFLFSGNRALTDYGAPALFWFALGNGVLVMASLLFTLQAAHGQLRLHVLNSTIGALIQVPLLAFVAIHYDVVTLGIVWLSVRLVMFAALSPIVHRRFRQGAYAGWLLGDIGRPLAGTAVGLGLSQALDVLVFHSAEITQRSLLLLLLVSYGLVTVACAAAASTEVRTILKIVMRRSLA